MKKILIGLAVLYAVCSLQAQKPCSLPVYRLFDFWLGEWEAFAPDGKKGGDSKISLILDSCIILEEWTSAGMTRGIRYAGKSFNTYNRATNQWQQTWVDNTGGTTEFLRGESREGQIIFYADRVTETMGKPFMRKLTFTKLSPDKVRQLGEKSTDYGNTWTTEYDLEYRRKK